ncbi:MAG: hypothetical protein Q9174_005426, partial [Haloplaca sp. 1 TL-2023]
MTSRFAIPPTSTSLLKALRPAVRKMSSANSTDQSDLISHFQSSLQSFSSSSTTFQSLRTVLHQAAGTPLPSPKTLHVLDSSFNPPTRAHLRIALSALRSTNYPKPQRLLLLLATQNADKAPKPAPFEHRLAMMTLFAQDIVDQQEHDSPLAVDVGVTKKPYYNDKAVAIEESHEYEDQDTGQQPEQVHLLGFDSLIRLLDTKYYPPSHKLTPLEPFFERHRIRVTRRSQEGSDWGTGADQDRYVEELAVGKMNNAGGSPQWAQRIEMVEGEGEDISSTRVRESAAKEDWDVVQELV